LVALSVKTPKGVLTYKERLGPRFRGDDKQEDGDDKQEGRG